MITEDHGDNNASSWEGSVNQIRRTTEKAVLRIEESLQKKINKVHERVIEAEARDATQEREIKAGMEKMMDSVKKQIGDLAQKHENQFNQIIAMIASKESENK